MCATGSARLALSRRLAFRRFLFVGHLDLLLLLQRNLDDADLGESHHGVPLLPAAAVQGRSLLPLCTGAADPGRHREYVYCEYYNAWTHRRSYGTMMRTGDKKIAVYHGIDEGELYDLAKDPDELENLWRSASHAAMRERMLKQAMDASVFTMDPMPPRLGPF